MAILCLSIPCKGDDTAIFYNVFIPYPGSTDTNVTEQQAMEIVREQIDYRESSITSNIPLYYVTIGKNIGELECTNCHKIDHYNEGTEIDTLSHLYEYCTIHQNSKVVYMHNKGSFHYSERNNRFRRMLTKAIFSYDCLHLKTPADPPSSLRSNDSGCECNICSARFSPIPYHYMSGNMWVAQCSYVSKLLHPTKIESEIDAMILSVPIAKFGNIQERRKCEIGGNRCSHEHWLSTHPDR